MAITQHLAILEASGLIRIAELQPELAYLFRHAMVQDTAYDSLLRQDRKRLHLAVAEALESLYPERCEVIAATLAHHYHAAGDDAKASQYFAAAADQALALYANAEAANLFRSALATSSMPPDRVHLYYGLGQALARIGNYEEAIHSWQQGVETASAIHDSDSAAQMTARQAWAAYSLSQSTRAIDFIEQGLAEVKIKGYSAGSGLAALFQAAGSMYLFIGQVHEAGKYTQQALDVATEINDIFSQCQALITLALIVPWNLGIEALEKAIEIAETYNLQDPAERAYMNLAGLLFNETLELERSRNLAWHALELSKAHGGTSWMPISALIMLASAYMGDASGLKTEQDRLSIFTEMPAHRDAIVALGTVGIALGWYGNWKEADPLLNGALGVLRSSKDVLWLGGIGITAVDIMIYAGKWDEAVALIEELIILPVLPAFLSYSMWVSALAAAMRARQGDLTEAHRLLESARQFGGENPPPSGYIKWVEATARVATCESRWDDAIAAYQSVIQFFEQVGAFGIKPYSLVELANVYAARNDEGDNDHALSILYEVRANFNAMNASGAVTLVEERIKAIMEGTRTE